MKGRSYRAAALLLALATPSAAAFGQELRDLALGWVTGDYRAPLVCVIEGSARQALRRVRIQPGPSGERPSVRLSFHDLDAPHGTACSGVTGRAEPNVIGTLQLVFDGRSRPDTGQVDFRNALRREGGFGFRVASGTLRIGLPGDDEAALSAADLVGTTVRLEAVPIGSDAARRLAPFGGSRQLQLELAPAGREGLVFELVDLSSP